MYPQQVKWLACPACHGALELTSAAQVGERVRQGQLTCRACAVDYPVEQFIPRFVPRQNYADSFGWQWNKHRCTQLDQVIGSTASHTRFFAETRWPPRLEGQLVLEVGGGAGRFTAHALNTGAAVVSIDYSNAVDANYASHGGGTNLLIAQADLYQMPFTDGQFDHLYCLGVLQHTPDVRRSFMSLPRVLRPGGSLTIDVYRTFYGFERLITKYWLRPLTRRLPQERLYAWVERYVRLMWPLSRLLNHLPGGAQLNWAGLCIPNYARVFPDLSPQALKQWAILDAFDMLSPRYDQPQALATIQRWFQEAGLIDIDVHYGYNGIEGRGRRPG